MRRLWAAVGLMLVSGCLATSHPEALSSRDLTERVAGLVQADCLDESAKADVARLALYVLRFLDCDETRHILVSAVPPRTLVSTGFPIQWKVDGGADVQA